MWGSPPPFVTTKLLKMAYCYPAYGCIHAIKQNGWFSWIESNNKMWHSGAKTWCSHIHLHEENYSSMFFAALRVGFSGDKCFCTLWLVLISVLMDGKGEEDGRMTCNPSNAPPRLSDNEEPSIRLFSFRPSLYCRCSISPAVAFVRSLCQSLLQPFFLGGSDFILLIHKIRLKIKTFGKTSPKKDVRKNNLICPVLGFYFAFYTFIFWLWSL